MVPSPSLVPLVSGEWVLLWDFQLLSANVLGLGKGSTVGGHWFGRGGVGTPPREGRRGQGEDSQRWLVAGAWHGKDQGAGECSLGWDRGDGYRECE